ncbi:emp24/gp25L/p24 family/GOLD [Novymonas esmeraldas]|uniref:Emp24/gp25L/p24 family/GOLD n=1 Tax=Novymonas esmeraldas TaxID=1808958 RepID=A0AAW0ESD4_9TRYP
MSRAAGRWLALLASALWLATGVQAAIFFHLNSADYPVYADEKMAMKNYAVLPASSNACVIVSLDSGLGGVVRFVYSSNVSDAQWRSDVLISTHKPSPTSPSVAVLDQADAVIATKVFNVAELEARNRAGETMRRSTSILGTEKSTVDAVLHERSSTHTIRPAMDGGGAGAKFVDGNYAVCFRLLRSKEAAQRPSLTQYEQVTIQLLEVASTRRSTSTYIAKLNNNAGNDAGAVGEADREYAKMVRSLFRASSTADLRSLLDRDELVTSHEMKARLEDLKVVQSQLFGLYTVSEHLEERYERMRTTAETTFTRIWVCMFLTITVMSGTIWFTFRYTKGIIIKKKLI